MLNTIVHGTPTARPPLLIAHGLFGSARNWGVIARRLSEGRQVSAVDMRNHGESFHDSDQSYFAMAADLAAVLTGPSDILGHSMGGKAAMVLALTRPDLVRRLIVADIAPVGYRHTLLDKIAAMQRVDPGRVTTRSEAGVLMDLKDDPLTAFLLQSLDLAGRRWRLNLDALAANMAGITGFPDVPAVFDRPTLFLTGGRSDYVLPEHHPGILTLFPHARFARIPDAGHWLHAEKPQEFVAAVAAFLEQG